jgi:multiple sugar transport system permease protein
MPLFPQVLGNTVRFVAMAATGEITLGLLLALALNHLKQGAFKRLQPFFQLIYFLPFVTPMISVALVWGWLYNPQAGVFNAVLQSLGLIQKPVPWLYQPETALGAVAILEIWKMMGYYMLLFYAGLQAIPESLYESACLDGASAWKRFWQITLPMLSPTVFFLLLITCIQSFQSFDAIYLLTQGGPENATTVLVYWLFQNAFMFYKIGPAAAIGFFLFAILATLTVLQWTLRKRWVLYES